VNAGKLKDFRVGMYCDVSMPKKIWFCCRKSQKHQLQALLLSGVHRVLLQVLSHNEWMHKRAPLRK
jgi:hypothetical protein